jgi:Zn-dependent protease
VNADWLVNGIVQYVVLIFSMTIHEAAHAWAAMRGGDLTAYHGGQVSLDPLPHIRRSPIGMVVVPIVSYLLQGFVWGWASAPLDPRWAWDHPRKAAWVSLAGPLANLTLALVVAGAIRLAVQGGGLPLEDLFGFGNGDGLVTGLGSLLWTLLSLNVLLCVFNLIPIPPLDGAGVLGLFLGERAARSFNELAMQPNVALFGMILIFFAVGRLAIPLAGSLQRLLLTGLV